MRSHTASAGVPAAACANHGAATISMNVSDTSVRQTKLDQSGCSPALMRPDEQPTSRSSTRSAATRAGGEHHDAAEQQRDERAELGRERREREQHGEADRRT